MGARAVRGRDWIDGAVIWIDDTDFATAARGSGLNMPALRNADVGSDTAKDVDVWTHAWREAEATHDTHYDLSVYRQPTPPFRTTPTWARNFLCCATLRAHVVDRGLICEHDCSALRSEGFVASIDYPENLPMA